MFARSKNVLWGGGPPYFSYFFTGATTGYKLQKREADAYNSMYLNVRATFANKGFKSVTFTNKCHGVMLEL